jgi:hypothetical protein
LAGALLPNALLNFKIKNQSDLIPDLITVIGALSFIKQNNLFQKLKSLKRRNSFF